MTTKEEKQLHGLGLKSVSSILEKYDGDIFLRGAVVSLVSGTGAYGDRTGGKPGKGTASGGSDLP